MAPAVHKLRVNVKSLAAEARYLRQEIRRTNNELAISELARHRSCRIKPEARLAHLALAYVKGKPYKSAECNAKQAPEPVSLARKICRFQHADVESVAEWLEA